jgi:hypothetical protein
VLVTGHTGFKGSWLARMLASLGAEVTGLALDPPPGPSGFAAMRVAEVLAADHRADIRDAASVAGILRDARPEVVLHLAAQAFVGRSYREPDATFATNVTGTVHLLDALRTCDGVMAALMVTSDKVYRNDGAGLPFTEGDPLGGEDPYSASRRRPRSRWRAGAPASRRCRRSRPHGPATSSAAATSPRCASSPTWCGADGRPARSRSAGRMPRGPSSTCSTCCAAT